jgi:hypothetical protein
MSARHNGRKPRTANQSAALRRISAQIQKMSDAEAYALTFADNRAVRTLAMRACHNRAEDYALSAEI